MKESDEFLMSRAMQPVSTELSDRARKNLATILRNLASVGQAPLARDLSTSETTVSRWKSEQLEFTARALAALELKVVPTSVTCFDPKRINAVLELARAHLNQIDTPEKLAWEDGEQ